MKASPKPPPAIRILRVAPGACASRAIAESGCVPRAAHAAPIADETRNVLRFIMVESMPKDSAGVLLFRGDAPDRLEVLLAHPGGPVWAKKDDQGWTIPKGEPSPGEDLLVAAKREFEEEMGSAPSGEFLALGSILQPSGRK